LLALYPPLPQPAMTISRTNENDAMQEALRRVREDRWRP
jgi:hypothetical protein